MGWRVAVDEVAAKAGASKQKPQTSRDRLAVVKANGA
jgi:hypothetical protein